MKKLLICKLVVEFVIVLVVPGSNQWHHGSQGGETERPRKADSGNGWDCEWFKSCSVKWLKKKTFKFVTAAFIFSVHRIVKEGRMDKAMKTLFRQYKGWQNILMVYSEGLFYVKLMDMDYWWVLIHMFESTSFQPGCQSEGMDGCPTKRELLAKLKHVANLLTGETTGNWKFCSRNK